MLSKTHGMSRGSPEPGPIPDAVTTTECDGSVGSPVAAEPDAVGGRVSDATATPTAATTTRATTTATTTRETRTQRFRRKAHRGRLHGYAIAGVALVAYLVALAASNTTQVKVSWAFGSSHVSLVWLVLFTAVLGWLLGLLTSARLHWRTRAPRPGGAGS
jgi:uncharacterized integral membrane protein